MSDKLEVKSPFLVSIFKSLNKDTETVTLETGSSPQNKGHFYFESGEPHTKLEHGASTQQLLTKSILNTLNGGSDEGSIEQLAFTSDPTQAATFAGLWRPKQRLIPDTILKRIAIQDDLVASIIQARVAQISAFGRPPKDRFSPGFDIEPKPGVMETMTSEQKAQFQKRCDVATEKLITCGSTKGWADEDKMTFSQYLGMTTRNILTVGRLATEIISTVDELGNSVFHSFRPIDAGTIYRITSRSEIHAQGVREQAIQLLQQLKAQSGKTEAEGYLPENDERFTWVQVIENQGKQVFTNEEMVCHNFYPISDIELDKYPVTPLDTVITAVTTHLSLNLHNKLWFQNGRGTKGMVIIKSDDVDQSIVGRIKQHFNASINSVANSFRMPVFAMNKDADVQFTPLEVGSGTRDMEFQYLSDSNARTIMAAFQISPEELPGYSHLSRGTNAQSGSEKDNEYQIEASRDLGIRPLIASFEDFLNSSILPLLDPDLAPIARIRLCGLDKDSAEKESTRLQQDMGVHYTMDEILDQVEKRPVGARWAGSLPLNQQYQAQLDKYFSVGEIKEHFFGIEGASKDPALAYFRDPFWFQQQQAMQAMQAMQAAAAPPPDASGPPSGGGPGGDQNPTPPGGMDKQQQPHQMAAAAGAPEESDLSRGIDQVSDMLSKSEHLLQPSKRRLLHQQASAASYLMEEFKQDIAGVIKTAVDVAERHLPEPDEEA